MKKATPPYREGDYQITQGEKYWVVRKYTTWNDSWKYITLFSYRWQARQCVRQKIKEAIKEANRVTVAPEFWRA